MKIRLNSYQISTIEFAFIIYLCAVYLLPSVSISPVLFLGMLLTYMLLLVVIDKRLLTPFFKVGILILLLALAYTLLTDASSISATASSRGIKRLFSKCYQYLSLYFPALLLMRICKAASASQKRIIMLVSLGLMAYVMFTTWIYLIDNPNATREWESFDETAEEGIANYYFIYAIPVIISVLAACFIRLEMKQKIVSLVVIVISVGFLLKTQYTLSILASFAGIAYQIYQTLGTRQKKAYYIIFIMLLSLCLPPLLKLSITHIESEQVTTRLLEIYDFLTGKGASGYNLNSRLTLYGNTIAAFFRSPIWGNRSLDFDGHATFLTVLSDTGLIGGIPFYWLLSVIIQRVSALVEKNGKQFKTVILVFVLMGLTNPVHASMPIGFATWFLAPLMIMTIFKEKKDGITSL